MGIMVSMSLQMVAVNLCNHRRLNQLLPSPKLLDSQFKALEEPVHAITVTIDEAPEEIVRQIIFHLQSARK